MQQCTVDKNNKLIITIICNIYPGGSIGLLLDITDTQDQDCKLLMMLVTAMLGIIVAVALNI